MSKKSSLAERALKIAKEQEQGRENEYIRKKKKEEFIQKMYEEIKKKLENGDFTSEKSNFDDSYTIVVKLEPQSTYDNSEVNDRLEILFDEEGFCSIYFGDRLKLFIKEKKSLAEKVLKIANEQEKERECQKDKSKDIKRIYEEVKKKLEAGEFVSEKCRYGGDYLIIVELDEANKYDCQIADELGVLFDAEGIHSAYCGDKINLTIKDE